MNKINGIFGIKFTFFFLLAKMASSKTVIKKLKHKDSNQKTFELDSSIKNKMIKKLFELNNKIISNAVFDQKQKNELKENTELTESLKNLKQMLNDEDSEESERLKENGGTKFMKEMKFISNVVKKFHIDKDDLFNWFKKYETCCEMFN